MRTDYYLMLEAKSQLKKESEQDSVDSTQMMKLLKKLNALSFRYFTKEHLWNICFKYGSTCNLSSPPPRPLTPVALDDTCSSENDMTCSASSNEQQKLTKLTLYDIWNQIAQQKDGLLDSYLSEFNKWFNTGIRPPARNTLLAKYIPGFRIGTITTESLELDEIYLAIPPQLVMDVMSAQQDRKIGGLLNNLLRIYKGRDDFHGLLFHLLYESLFYGSESLYWNYLRLLPSPKEMDIPLFWSDNEIISRLGPSSLTDEMLEYKARVKRNYEMLTRVPLLEELILANVLNEDTYFWATAILDSRSIWWNGQRHLVPMLDFINCQERMGDRNEVIRIHSTKVERFPLRTDEIEVIEGETKLMTETVLAVTRAGNVLLLSFLT